MQVRIKDLFYKNKVMGKYYLSKVYQTYYTKLQSAVRASHPRTSKRVSHMITKCLFVQKSITIDIALK